MEKLVINDLEFKVKLVLPPVTCSEKNNRSI